MLALVPVVIAVVMAVPIVLAMRRLAGEVVALRRAMALFAELASPIAELRGEARAVAGRVPELRERARPTATSAP